MASLTSKAQPVTQNTSTTLPSWFTAADQGGVNLAAGATPYTPYSGQGTAPLTPAQQLAISQYTQGVGGPQSVAMGAQPGFTNAMGFSAPQMTGASVGGNINGLLSPYTQANVDAANTQLDKNTATAQSNTDQGLAAQHAFGGDRQGIADADVQNQGAMTKASTDAGIYTNDFTNALNASTAMGTANQNAAIGSAGINLGGANGLSGLGTTLGGLNMQQLQGLLTGGGVQQGTNQAADTFNVGQYSQAYNSQYQQMTALAQMLGAAPQSSTGTNTSTSYTDPLLQGLGLGTSILGLGTGGGSTVGGGLLSSLFGGSSGSGSQPQQSFQNGQWGPMY